MQYDVVWETLYTTAVEHHRLRGSADGGWQADGHVVGVVEGEPFRLAYDVRLDSAWRVREVVVSDLLGGRTAVHLHADGFGRWRGADGSPLSTFDGCIDIDFTATPFTNTLPIRRLVWEAGTAAVIRVVYIVHPGLMLSVAEQTYTCLATGSDGAHFRFTMADFERDIRVDDAGYVTDYPGLFARRWTERRP